MSDQTGLVFRQGLTPALSRICGHTLGILETGPTLDTISFPILLATIMLHLFRKNIWHSFFLKFAIIFLINDLLYTSKQYIIIRGTRRMETPAWFCIIHIS